jgi:hypothetical protein
MEKNIFNSQAEASLTAAQLQQLYDILLESDVPYAANVRKANGGLRQITVLCHDTDLCYWQTTLTRIGGRAHD